MVNSIFLIFAAIIIAVLILGIALVTLIKFQHPDDKNQAWIPKFIIILSFLLVFGSSMIMPFDVATRQGNLSFDVDIIWLVCLCSVAGFLLLVIPFAFFYYEADSELDEEGEEGGACKKCCKQFGSAVSYSLLFCLVILILAVILFATPANTAIIPTHRITAGADLIVPICAPTTADPAVSEPAAYKFAATFNSYCASHANDATTPVIDALLGCSTYGKTFNWEISVTYPVYLLALLCFIGWWFFFLFTGVGLIALPMSLINDFRRRPKPMGKAKYMAECDNLTDRANSLIDKARTLRDGAKIQEAPQGFWARRKQRKATAQITELENEFYFLRRDFDILKMSYEFSKSNPLWFFLKLILGILGLIVSLLWIIHICIFVLPGKNHRLYGFLNVALDELSGIAGGDFPRVGVMLYAILTFWLMWCTIEGNQKFGLRFLLWRFYPMEVGNTMMNAFLANLWVLLLCVFPQVQFVSQALPIYARYTAIEALFGQQVRYLNGFRVFWEHNIFVIIMLGIAGLTLIFMLLCPGKRDAKLKKKIEERMTQRERRI